MSSLVSYGQLRPAFIGALGVIFGRLLRSSASPAKLQNVDKVIEFSDSGVWGGESVDPNSDFKVFRVSDFKGDFQLNLSSPPYRSIPEHQQDKFRLKRGDILVVKSSGSAKQVVSGRVAVFDEDTEQPYAASNFLLRLRPSAEIDPDYLAYALGSPPIREAIADTVKTMTYPNLSFKLYRELLVPLIPLAEQRQVARFLQAFFERRTLPELPSYLRDQRRIVARIDELSAKIEEARGLRDRSVREGDALVQSQLATAFVQLSETHGTRPLASLIKEAGYGTSIKCHPDREADAVPVLRIPNVLAERVDLRDLKYGVLEVKDLNRVLLSTGDVLVVRTNGSADLVGRSAVVPNLEEPTAFASYMIRIRCNDSVVPAYLQLVLKHLRTQGELIDFARTTAGQYNVSLGRLRAAAIPIPPLEEQRRIVAYLDDLQAKVDSLKTLQEETAKERNALMPSILSKAFAGEL